MSGVVATLVLMCSPQAPCANATAHHLGGLEQSAVKDLHALQGRLIATVETVLRGVTLFEARADSTIAQSISLRPDFGKGPLAMFDLRF